MVKLSASSLTGRIAVRQAVFADLEPLATLFDRYRRFQGQASDLAAAQEFLAARFDHGESVVFIAHAGMVPVGLAQLYPSYSSVSLTRVFVLNDLFVDEAARRQGVASMMLGAVEAYAWAHGAARVTLNVARDNPSGKALYESLGWHQDTKYFMYHRFPADIDPGER
jgi:ribosomal protein S18 acetylase RimI-like enzyme